MANSPIQRKRKGNASFGRPLVSQAAPAKNPGAHIGGSAYRRSLFQVTKGLVAGLGVTFKTAMRTMFPKRGAKTLIPAPSLGALTVQYPHELDAPTPRARGVIALHTENCTACMLCARECPDWCIYIEGHKTLAPPRREGGKPRSVNELDRFDIDYSLCMYCGICVEVCPFEALFWSPEFEYSEPRIADLIHDKGRLSMWMETVPPFETYEAGSEAKVDKVPEPVPRDRR